MVTVGQRKYWWETTLAMERMEPLLEEKIRKVKKKSNRKVEVPWCCVKICLSQSGD